MIRRLEPEMRIVYNNIINEQLSRGFIEEVENDDHSGHYLPHRGVKKDSVTTPLRIVFDCSCKSGHEPSLNDCLETGPSLLNDLASIIIRFRLHKFAISADIEKAFLQIGLDSNDRKFTKFLWLSDQSNPESELKAYQFRSVLFGAVCNPYILNVTVKSHLRSIDTETARDISDNIYVDNDVTGVSSDTEALRFYHESVDITKSAGLNLRSWATNSGKLREQLETDEVADSDTESKILGLIWNTQWDSIGFPHKLKNELSCDVVTKREVVSRASKVFDPLGFLAPVQIRAKIFIQELWKEKFDLDQPIPDDLKLKWIHIATDLCDASEIHISRKYFEESDRRSDYEIHAFGDSSKEAYGSVVYLRNLTDTSLVMVKTRVAPVKELTIPQLELLAALTAARLITYVYRALASKINISKTILWSDNQIVLHWIHSDKKLPVFVSNSVTQIKLVNIDEFKYCPTKDNPADILSSGICAADLQNCDLWWKGPHWLGQGDWPICELFDSQSC
ncbi:uncharacterized protein LOC141904297 [Tubulanus polymorphus]|uniref:uncharacterized protein LOC141904297 n=1 Tax=Tubulanus polymorphus TaxID=672921 RepID=UPI003DA33F92